MYTVGEYYRVPCVKGMWMDTEGVWPVFGPEHEDSGVVGFDRYHWHVHPQFIIEKGVKVNGVANWMNYPVTEGEFVGHRLRKCKRAMPPYDFRPPWLDELGRASGPLRGSMCPHKGADLSCVPVINGEIVCPLHGLRFNAKTGNPT